MSQTSQRRTPDAAPRDNEDGANTIMQTSERSDPRQEYTERLSQRKQEILGLERSHRRTGNFRLLIVAAAIGIVWLSLATGRISILWMLVPLAGFAFVLIAHERMLRRLEARRRAALYYEKGLARLDGNWSGSGETGAVYLDPAHLYSEDLDLFGTASLFQLLSTARTHIGEDTLARWLTRPAPPATVYARQEAVEELRGAIDLREDLAVLAEQARTGVDPVALAAWGESAPQLTSRRLRVFTIVFTAIAIPTAVMGIVAFFASLGFFRLPEPAGAFMRDGFFVVYAAGVAILHRMRGPTSAVLESVEHAAHDLNLLAQVIFRLERESFRSPLLRGLRVSLDTEGAPPSARIASLNRIMQWLDSRDNVFVRVIGPAVVYPLHMAFAVESWRRHSGPAVRRWLAATGEIEALCSLASYAFEHPEDPFPEFVSGEPCFEAEAIAHPLLPEDRAVRNDIALGGALRVIVVSGSNMSGKSTMLRTIGVNTVLAQAGAPVRARRLRLSPLMPGASVRVVDSLHTGTSRFYAEIIRLRDILNATREKLPVLFLLDEFLHGTNSHDRRVGAEALVRGLVDRGAIGLITTHDLALAHIADALAERAANVHFEDHLEDGVMKFDYVMRPGIVRKSNAIELMRSVGLEI